MSKLALKAVFLPFLPIFLFFPDLALAQEGLDTGDTTWIMVSTALVLFMMIPGLALFYGGLVAKKNVLSILMQCFAVTAVVTIIWTIVGYSLTFDTTGMVAGEWNLNAFVGGFDKAFLHGITPDTLSGSIPELSFFAFQLTFAIITPGLFIGKLLTRFTLILLAVLLFILRLVLLH